MCSCMILDLRMLDAHHKLDCEELKAVLSLNILLCIYPDFDSFFMIKVRKLIIASLMKCSLKNNGSLWKLYIPGLVYGCYTMLLCRIAGSKQFYSAK